nr:unnamed protein product [Callosobruchus chinensis]
MAMNYLDVRRSMIWVLSSMKSYIFQGMWKLYRKL